MSRSHLSEYQCDACNLVFESKSSHHIHRTRFCPALKRDFDDDNIWRKLFRQPKKPEFSQYLKYEVEQFKTSLFEKMGLQDKIVAILDPQADILKEASLRKLTRRIESLALERDNVEQEIKELEKPALAIQPAKLHDKALKREVESAESNHLFTTPVMNQQLPMPVCRDIQLLKTRYLSIEGHQSDTLAAIEALEREALEIEQYSPHASRLQQNNFSDEPNMSNESSKTVNYGKGVESSLDKIQAIHNRYLLQMKMEREKLLLDHEMKMLKTHLRFNPSNEIHFEEVSQAPNNSDVVITPTRSESQSQFLLTPKKCSNDFHINKYGCHLFWDFVLGMPLHLKGSAITASVVIFDGSHSVENVPIQVIGPVPLLSSRLQNAHIVVSTWNVHQPISIQELPETTNVRVLVECRVFETKNANNKLKNHEISFGWTSFDLYRDRNTLDIGQWKIPLFPTPTDFNITTTSLYSQKDPIPNVFVCFRFGDNANFSILQSQSISHQTDFASYHMKRYLATQRYEYENLGAIEVSEINRSRNDLSRYPPLTSPLSFSRSVNDWLSELVLPLEETSTVLNDIQKEKKLPTGPTFAFGVQIEEIMGLHTNIPLRVRMRVIDRGSGSDGRIHFTSENAEASTVDGAFGFQTGAYHEFQALVGVPDRAALFQLVVNANHDGSGGQVIGEAQLELFKFHLNVAFDVNDGLHHLELANVSSTAYIEEEFEAADERQAILVVRIYKLLHGRPPPKRFEPKLIAPPIPPQAWIRTTLRVSDRDKITFKEKGLPFTFSVIAGRFLPENVTATRVVVRLVSSNMKSLSSTMLVSKIQLDTPVYFPNFSASGEFRMPKTKDSVLYIQVFTIDRYSREVVLAGTTLLNVYRSRHQGKVSKHRDMTRDGTDPSRIDGEDEQSYEHHNNAKAEREEENDADEHDYDVDDYELVLNEGCFQLSLFQKDTNKKMNLNWKEFFNIPKIPCASLLVCLRPGSMQANEAEIFPPYDSGKYVSDPYSCLTTYEKYLFPFVVGERKPFTTRDRVLSMGSLPKSALQGDPFLINWLHRQLNNKAYEKIKLLDTSMTTFYDPKYGFKISVDSAQSLPYKGVTIAVLSYYPPGPYYRFSDDVRKNLTLTFQDDVTYTKRIDYTSPWRKPKFLDDYHWFRRRPFVKHSFVVIDLVCITKNEKEKFKVEDQGWTIVPVFHPSGQFVRMGSFVCPLFEQFPDSDLLKFIEDKGPEKGMIAAFETQKIEYSHRAGAAVHVRMTDGRRGDELTSDVCEPVVLFAEEVEHARYLKGMSGSSTINSLVPRKMSSEDYNEQVFNYFVEDIGIQLS